MTVEVRNEAVGLSTEELLRQVEICLKAAQYLMPSSVVASAAVTLAKVYAPELVRRLARLPALEAAVRGIQAAIEEATGGRNDLPWTIRAHYNNLVDALRGD